MNLRVLPEALLKKRYQEDFRFVSYREHFFSPKNKGELEASISAGNSLGHCKAKHLVKRIILQGRT